MRLGDPQSLRVGQLESGSGSSAERKELEAEHERRRESSRQLERNKQIQRAKDQFDKADFDEKLTLVADPTSVLIEEIRKLRRKVEDNTAYIEAVDEVARTSAAILNGLRGEGECLISKIGLSWVVDTRYRGPHWCYAKGDGTVLWNTGGYINSGADDIAVTAADIASELDTDTHQVLFYELTVNTGTGNIAQTYVSFGTAASNLAPDNTIRIPLIEYSKGGDGIVLVHQQFLTETPTVYSWTHVDQDSGTVYGISREIFINSQHTH